KIVVADSRMIHYKSYDSSLYLLKIFKGLGYSYYGTVHSNRVNNHSRRRHYKAVIRRYSQGNTNGVSAALYQRNRRLTQGGNHFSYSKPCLHVTTNRINQNKQPINFCTVFNGCQLWQYMLILSCLVMLRETFVAFNFTDNR